MVTVRSQTAQQHHKYPVRTQDWAKNSYIQPRRVVVSTVTKNKNVSNSTFRTLPHKTPAHTAASLHARHSRSQRPKDGTQGQPPAIKAKSLVKIRPHCRQESAMNCQQQSSGILITLDSISKASPFSFKLDFPLICRCDHRIVFISVGTDPRPMFPPLPRQLCRLSLSLFHSTLASCPCPGHGLSGRLRGHVPRCVDGAFSAARS